ncbi:MAG: hypothetical protein NC311_20085 [Muribaculaceae bacterium]|nr:hypothetical protein [Muribaculaceae bacterium]
MKKIITTLSIAIVSIFAFQLSAQQRDAGNRDNCGERKERHEMKRPDMFQGISLTAEQQSQIDNLKKECCRKDSVERVAKRQKQREAMKQKQDKRKEMQQSRLQKKRDYLNSVKAILTPDQYVVFLENIVVNQPVPNKNFKMDRMRKMPQPGKDRKGGKMRPDGPRGPRMDNSNPVAGK